MGTLSQNIKKIDVNVMLIIDNDFVYYSMPFIYSLIKNNKEWASFKFHIVTDNLDEDYKFCLSDFISKNDAELNVYYVDSKAFSGLKVVKKYPLLLYYKLVPHIILPNNIDKALFFDVDMVCVGNIKSLYDVEMGDYYFAMCYGIDSIKALQSDEKNSQIKKIHNSGTVLINLKALRENNITIQTYLDYAKKHEQKGLFEEYFFNYMHHDKILSLMPFDYNFNIGGRRLYSAYCKKYNIEPKKLILHYMPFFNDSPIKKPWDAYEYFYYGKSNDIFDQEIWELYKPWWDYAKELSSWVVLSILQKAQNNKINNSIKNINDDREKWKIYSESFKYLLMNDMVYPCKNRRLRLVDILLTNDFKHIAIYGDREITKVLLHILYGTEVNVDYVVENSLKPVVVDGKTYKTINRTDANYPKTDAMFVADIAYYNVIKTKLDKMKVPFPVYNAADYIKSLPVYGDADVMSFKDNMTDIISENNNLLQKQSELNARVDTLIKMNAESLTRISELGETVGILRADNKRLTETKSAIVKQKSEAVSRLNSDKDKIAAARAQAENDLAALRGSVSFKLGRAITFIPRKIRDSLRGKKKNGEERKK